MREEMNKPLSIILVSALGLVAGCSGTMQGVIRGEGTRVPFQYEQGMDSDAYTAVIDGETFKGKAVQANARSGVGTSSSGETVFMNTSSGNFVATMFGNKGSTMRCSMNYADSYGLTTSGGVGVCQHSDGRVIDVMW